MPHYYIKEREKSHGHDATKKDHSEANSQTTSYYDTTHSSPYLRPLYSFGIFMIVLTGVVSIIVSTYVFKRLKKRHCDYEEVSELNVDRLLYI